MEGRWVREPSIPELEQQDSFQTLHTDGNGVSDMLPGLVRTYSQLEQIEDLTLVLKFHEAGTHPATVFRYLLISRLCKALRS